MRRFWYVWVQTTDDNIIRRQIESSSADDAVNDVMEDLFQEGIECEFHDVEELYKEER